MTPKEREPSQPTLENPFPVPEEWLEGVPEDG